MAIGRLLVLLIPLIGLIYPLFRLMPALYAWEVRWRIFRTYREYYRAEGPSGRPPHRLRARPTPLAPRVEVRYGGQPAVMSETVARRSGREHQVNPNKALWEKGDFTRIAARMRESGEALVARLGITKGTKVLDLACGDGTTALPEARLGADVLGVDIASNLVEAGNRRAQQAGLTNCRFQEGDATHLSELADKRFDLVVSIFGATGVHEADSRHGHDHPRRAPARRPRAPRRSRRPPRHRRHHHRDRPPGLAARRRRGVDARGLLLHPGLINAHTHAHGNLAKGMGDRWTLELLLTAALWISGNRTGRTGT